MAAVEQLPSDALLVFGYGGSSRAFACEEGNYYGARHYTEQLQRLEPDALFYDIWNHHFYTFGRRRVAAGEVFERGRPVYLFCYSLEKPWPEWGFPQGLPQLESLKYTKVADFGVRCLYRLEFVSELTKIPQGERGVFRFFD